MRSTWTHTLLSCVVALMLMAAVGHADSLGGYDLRTGVMSFAGGRTSIRVTVSDVGAVRGISRVHIVLLDDTDRVLLEQDQTMQPGQPARADLRLEAYAGTIIQARAVVLINYETGSGHAPVAVLEHLDIDSFRIIPRVICSLPAGRVDPVTLAKCDGMVVTKILAGG